jgi:SAM-dependent methyltransferase
LLKTKEKELWQNVANFSGYDEETFKALMQYCGRFGLIFEVGCGSGSWTGHLCEVADEVIGVDFSKGLIRSRELKNQNCSVILSDAEFLPFTEETADQCIFTFSLHHMVDIDSVLQDAARCLQKNGLLILLEPNGTNPIRYLGFQFVRLLSKAGILNIKSIEKPVDIRKTVRVLKKLGFNAWIYPSMTTINELQGYEQKIICRLYFLSLKSASRIFPSILGSSDFILIGKKGKT